MNFAFLVVRFLAPIAIIGAGVFDLLTFGRPPEAESTPVTTTSAALVDVATARAYDGPFLLTVDGEAVSSRVVKVAAEISGRVIAKPSSNQAGLVVHRDEMLFEVDPTDYELEIVRLKAQLAQANERIRENEISLENSESLVEFTEGEWRLSQAALNRMESLQERRAASTLSVEQASREELVGRRAIQSLKNEIRLLKQKHASLLAERDLVAAQLKRAEADLARTTIRAPFEGSIVADTTEVGDYVQRGDKVVEISDTSIMEVKCELRVDELVWIWRQAQQQGSEVVDRTRSSVELPPTPVEVVFSFRDAAVVWDGVLLRYEGVGLDQETRAVPCRVHVDNPSEARLIEGSQSTPIATPPALLSGMHVQIRIPINSPKPLLQLPHRAVRPGGRVWVVKDGGLYEEPVTVVQEDTDYAIVEVSHQQELAERAHKLDNGSQVVVSPLPGVTDGMAVRVRNAE